MGKSSKLINSEEIVKKKILKIKEEYYKVMKQMTDKQIAEFIKAICGYAFDGKPMVTKDNYLKGLYMYVQRDFNESVQNSINGKKGADKLAEKRRNKSTLGVFIESVVVASGNQKKAE